MTRNQTASVSVNMDTCGNESASRHMSFCPLVRPLGASLHSEDQQSSGKNSLQGAVHVPVQVSFTCKYIFTH